MREKAKYAQSESDQIQDLMNEIPELVYVSAIDTYELLFMNAAGREKFATQLAAGGKCYQVLQGLDAPCPFCTTSLLSYDKVYVWEHHNPTNGCYYALKDKLVPWNGRGARMEIAFDITQQTNEKLVLQHGLEADKVVMECVRKLYSTTDLDATCHQVMAEIGRYWSADRTYLFEIRDGKMNNTVEWCAPGIVPQRERLQGLDINLIDRWRSYFDLGECVVVEDTRELAESFAGEYEVLTSQHIHSLVVAPLERDGKLVGYFGVDNPPHDKIQNVAPLFQTLRYFLMASRRRTEDEQLLVRLSYYDGLTGLFNRNRFTEDLKRESGPPEPTGVVYLDINGLKAVNDGQGHAAGDRLLVDCARKMERCMEGSELYRIGGDEFVSICRGVSREDFDSQVLELKKQFADSGTCPAAIGSEWNGNTSNVQTMIASASELMYNDKKSYYRLGLSADRYRHYNDDVLGLTQPEFLDEMLSAGSFLVYFQPKVSFQDRRITGSEALVRYRMADGAIVPPQQFIPLLEDARLISRVDFHVLGWVCAQIAQWLGEGRQITPVSVNFSRYSLMEKCFISRLEAVCSQYGVEKKWIQIEVTESVEGADGFDVGGCIGRIGEAGFAVSIDDFGARYANLSLFASTHFDVLKIDKSLVDDISSNPNVPLLLELVSAFCEKLCVETVAEGVETEEQFQALQGIGIRYAQGYLFSRPLPSEEYTARYLPIVSALPV